MSNHAAIVRDYSDTTLDGIILQLSMTRQWPERLKAAIAERERRKKI